MSAKVYYTHKVTPESLMEVYKVLGVELSGRYCGEEFC